MDEIVERLQEIERRLDSLSIIAGDGIKVSKTELGLVISSSAPEFSSRLSRWLLDADKRIGGPTLLEGRNISFEMEAQDRIRIHAKVPEQSYVSKPQAAFPDFPFRVLRSGANSATLLGYNEGKSRLFRNYVTLGSTRLEVPETEFTEISSDSWVYLEISYDSEEGYMAEPICDTELPDDESDAFYVPIAFIKASDGSLAKIHQVQFGQLEFPGRIF